MPPSSGLRIVASTRTRTRGGTSATLVHLEGLHRVDRVRIFGEFCPRVQPGWALGAFRLRATMARTRTHNVMAAQWQPNGSAMGATDLTAPGASIYGSNVFS